MSTSQPVAAGTKDDFGVALYRAVATRSGNQFISPFSVANAFGLIYAGARGTTAAEIADTFSFPATPSAQAARSRSTIDLLTSQTGNSEFTTANAAWVDRSLPLRVEYEQTISDELGATVAAVDFVNDPSGAVDRINDWAARETHGRIPSVVSDPSAALRLVLTNAVYFKGKWRDRFSANATREGDFHTASGGVQRAQLMRQETYARYFEDAGFQAAEFDYDDGAFALAVFLPREPTGLDGFEPQLTGAHLDAWLERLTNEEPTELDVTLPKVELSSTYNLIPQLRSLGVRAAFRDDADLSGITEEQTLAVSAVMQKTFLAIDEEGTEAGAVTVARIVVTGSRLQWPIEFKADHPFFIVLRHKPTDTRLFYGRIASV